MWNCCFSWNKWSEFHHLGFQCRRSSCWIPCSQSPCCLLIMTFTKPRWDKSGWIFWLPGGCVFLVWTTTHRRTLTRTPSRTSLGVCGDLKAALCACLNVLSDLELWPPTWFPNDCTLFLLTQSPTLSSGSGCINEGTQKELQADSNWLPC